MQKNRIIKPKIRWKAKKSLDIWQGWHQAFEVQQALIADFCVFQSIPQGVLFLFAKFTRNENLAVLEQRKRINLSERSALLLGALCIFEKSYFAKKRNCYFFKLVFFIRTLSPL